MASPVSPFDSWVWSVHSIHPVARPSGNMNRVVVASSHASSHRVFKHSYYNPRSAASLPPPQSTYVAPLCLSCPLDHRRPHAIAPSTPTIMSLTAVPTEVQIEIVGHLTVTSEWPMDDPSSLRVTCLSMHCICGDPAIGRRLALDRFKCGRMWDDPIDYEALLASLTQVGNSEACFLTRIQTVFMDKHSPQLCLDDIAHATDGRHNLVAYLVALLLHRNNGDVGDDDTVRR